MSRWFKFYDSVLDDPKVQRLPRDVFWGWVSVLCLASKHGGDLPALGDIAFALRISDREAESLINALLGAGLIDDVGDTMRPHNWDQRQSVDRTNAERQRRFRERKGAVTERNAVTPVTVTALDKRREEERREDAREARGPSSDLIFPKDGTIEFSRWAELCRAHARGRDVDRVASEFRKFCHGKGIEFHDRAIEKTFITFCQKQHRSVA